ncbi:hypothetical protein M3Y94_00373100 [Aphelenchoides besseyi]|nr:hypothetical protein M3Y94_00373100 [Aphelenchoides besseyi]
MTTNSRRPGLLCSARLNFAFLSFLGCVILYASRSNLSFSLVCMVNNTAIELQNGPALTSKKNSECEINTSNNHTSTDDRVDGDLLWPKSTQGMLLSAFFWGYTTSQIIGGHLATHYGGRIVVLVAALISALATLLSTSAAKWSVGVFVGLRAILGAAQGAIFPALQTMWTYWAPPLERSFLVSCSFAGAQIGNVLVMPLSGFLCKHAGYPSIFYSLGIVGLLWAVLWFYGAADSPKSHKRIKDEEKSYIIESLQDTIVDEEERSPVPWIAVFKSKAVWACFIGHFCGDWGAYSMALSLPLYMNDIMGYDLTSLGFIASIPYVFYFIMINVAGFMADYIRQKGFLSTLNTRRAAMILAFGSQALLFLILIGTAQCGQQTLVIVYLSLGIGLSGIQFAGYPINYLDIAPKHVGPIFGVGNTISCFAGVLSPLVMSSLVRTGSSEEWQTFFGVTSAILVAGALAFCLMADGEVQSWSHKNKNLPEKLENKHPEKENLMS